MARILLIDDDEQMRRIMARILVREGHDVIEAADGKQGIEFFRRDPRDVVITDLLMPEKDGIETIRKLRAISPQVRIIAMSGAAGTAHDSYLQIAKHLGADTGLCKPFKVEELLAVIAEPTSADPSSRGYPVGSA